jgi:hypothetical protein
VPKGPGFWSGFVLDLFRICSEICSGFAPDLLRICSGFVTFRIRDCSRFVPDWFWVYAKFLHFCFGSFLGHWGFGAPSASGGGEMFLGGFLRRLVADFSIRNLWTAQSVMLVHTPAQGCMWKSVHFLRKIHGHAGPTHCIWRNKDVSRYTSVLRGRT